ncbi:MAG: hypothetical protein V7711_17965 [Pseudomonadales bacterium]
MLFRFIFIISAFLFFSACAANKEMEASFSSQVEPDHSVSTNNKLAVLVSEKGNVSESKPYVKQVVDALKLRGFKNVYSYNDIPNTADSFDLAVLIDLSKRTDVREYQKDIYDFVDNGKTRSVCVRTGGSTQCNDEKELEYEVVGQSMETESLTGYYFSLHWINAKNKKKVMLNFGTSYEEECSDKAVYSFLISQTISRLDFENKDKHEYTVKMPEGYNCS